MSDILVTSSDRDYEPGAISSFPIVLDSADSLLQVSNGVETQLAAPMSTHSDTAILVDGSKAPFSSAVIRIGDELIYYRQRIGNRIFKLERGFAGTDRSVHASMSTVTLPVVADMHNGPRDVIMKLQDKVGLPSDAPGIEIGADSLWARANFLDLKWFTPRSIFNGFNRDGHVPLAVQFIDRSIGEPVRRVWEFGDGNISTETHPLHVYEQPGLYEVTLTIFGSRRSGVASKRKIGYVNALGDNDLGQVMFYIESESIGPSFSGRAPFSVRFVDQTRGPISSRTWSFDDSAVHVENDPKKLDVVHVYTKPGLYYPALVVTDGVTTARKVFEEGIEVLA